MAGRAPVKNLRQTKEQHNHRRVDDDRRQKSRPLSSALRGMGDLTCTGGGQGTPCPPGSCSPPRQADELCSDHLRPRVGGMVRKKACVCEQLGGCGESEFIRSHEPREHGPSA
eukprot:2009387-Prymnesium_polylepis.1